MLGRSHATLGAAGFLAGAPWAAMHLHATLRPLDLAAGTLVAAGTALWPDADHPGSTVGRAIGPASHLIEKLAGGHRRGTHSIPGAALVGVGMLALARVGPLERGVIFAACAWLALGIWRAPHRELLTVAAGIAGGVLPVAPMLIACAVVAGMLAHDFADTLTTFGTRLFYPLPWIVRLPVCGRTGSWREHVVAVLALAGAVLTLVR